MLLEIEKELLGSLKLVLKDYSEDLCLQFEKLSQENYPYLEIAPYADLVFGSKIAINFSRFAKLQGLSILPHELAEKIKQDLVVHSNLPCSIFLGESSFVNFRPDKSKLIQYMNNKICESPKEYLEILYARYNGIVKKNTSLKSFNNIFLETIQEREDDLELFLENLKLLNNTEYDFLSKLLYISNQEYDEGVVNLISRYAKIIKQIKEKSLENIPYKSNSLYLDDYYQASIEEALSAFDNFILRTSFHIFDYYKDGRTKEFLYSLNELITLILKLWNNEKIRSELVGFKSSSSFELSSLELSSIRAKIIWINNILTTLKTTLTP